MGSILKLLARLISRYGGLVNFTLINLKSIEGEAFGLRKRFEILKNSTLDILLDPTGFTGKEIIFLPFDINTFEKPVYVDIYEDVTASDDGDPLQFLNKNRKSESPPQVIARKNPITVDITGLKPSEFLIPTSSGDPTLIVLDETKKYLIRLTNKDVGKDITVGVQLDYFTVT